MKQTAKVYTATNHLGQSVAIQVQSGSTNSKTGDGVQIWILPLAWITEGKQAMSDDSASCMDCIHSKRANRTCYVRKGMSEMGLKNKVNSLHKQYLAGTLELLDVSQLASNEVEVCRGKFVRFGAYGEPVLLGEANVQAITSVASNFTGYTHQWFLPQFQWASKYFMSSADTEGLSKKAQAMGWRTFRVMTGTDSKLTTEVTCPASKEGGKKVTCNTCGLCKGTTIKAKSIAIIKH
jgi:hypothetical protein